MDNFVENAAKSATEGVIDVVGGWFIDAACAVGAIAGAPVGYPIWKVKKWAKGGDDNYTWWQASRDAANDLKGYLESSTAGTLGKAKANSHWLFYAVCGSALTFYIVCKYKK